MPPKSAKKPMDSKFEFWNALPNEMQTECIKRMDFKTRMQLRATSKQDKLLVESTKKYHFDSIYCNIYGKFLPIVICEKNEKQEVKLEIGFRAPGRWNSEDFRVKIHQLVIQILKFASADNITICSDPIYTKTPPEFMADCSNLAPFHFKNVTLICNLEICKILLKNCTFAESIYILKFEEQFYGRKSIGIAKIPAVINAKSIRLRGLDDSRIPWRIISNWLDKKDLELGKTLKMDFCAAAPLSVLAEKFENRVVSQSAETLRLRTKKPTKHILINANYNEHEFISCTAQVIPSGEKPKNFLMKKLLSCFYY